MKKVALINDLSGFGKCSLTAAIPVISVIGVQACPMPTAVLTAQTGFESYYCDDFTDKMDYFTKEWQKMDVAFDGIYSGYLAGSLQMEKVKTFLDYFQKEDTFYLADPVMGDNGHPYPFFNNALLLGMKELTSRANIITPNLTELCLLADADYSTLNMYRQSDDFINKIEDICKSLLWKAQKQQTIIVTGIIQEKNSQTLVMNLAVSPHETISIETPYTGISFSGTGDLFASAICGYLVKGLHLQEAMAKASSFLQPAIEEATNANIPRNHGIPFEKYLSKLL